MKKKTTKKKVSTKKSPKIVVKNDDRIMPLGNRVLIKPFTKEELEKKTNFGIILPDSDKQEKSEQGKVLAVGPGEIDDGKRVPIAVKVGDRVVFSKYGYDEITLDGEELYLIKEENILAVLK
jgi:chaperonin GroES